MDSQHRRAMAHAAAEYPNYKTVHRRSQTWCSNEVLCLVLTDVANELRDRGALDEEECFIDATFCGHARSPPAAASLAGADCAAVSAVTQLLLSETNRPGVVGMVFAFGATDSNIGLPEIGVGPFFVRRRLIILTKA